MASIGNCLGHTLFGIGTLVADKVAQKTGVSLGAVLNNPYGRYLARGLGKITDVVQWPMNKVQELKLEYVSSFPLHQFNQQVIAAKRLDFVCRTFIAPIYEEIAYRGAIQFGGGVLLAPLVGPGLGQLISGIVSDIMFGLAHNQNVSSETFISTSSKGVFLALSAGMNGLPTSLTEAGIALIVPTIVHIFNNSIPAIQEYMK